MDREELIAPEFYNLALVCQNESGNPLGVGEVGDVAVHRSTPVLFQQYYKDPERTERLGINAKNWTSL